MRKQAWISILLLALVACSPGGLAFSPQQAAFKAANRNTQRGAVVDQNSVQVRQTVELGGKTFVLVSYRQQVEARQEECLTLYEARKELIGTWAPGSGGGGCSGALPGAAPDPKQPMDIGSGSSGSGDARDPGFAHVNGLVNQKEIEKVRVTWNDNETQEVPVSSESYLAVRIGNYRLMKVEGLGANDEVLYEYTPQSAPGKE